MTTNATYPPYTKLFEQAEIAKYNPAERRLYEESRKEYWDYTSTLQTAENKGRAEGSAEGKREANENMARNMKADGMPVEAIAKYTGLSVAPHYD